jgi:drug/metabolite transporter (DMT)-like permease
LTWANAALFSAGIMALVTVFDSHLVSKRLPSLRAFMLPVGTIHLCLAIATAFLAPLPVAVVSPAVGYAVFSSLIRVGAILILLDSLRREQVSTVIPVVYTYPVFVAIMAFAFLGERLQPLQWGAVCIVVVGAVLISVGRGPSRSDIARPRAVLLFVSSLLFAAADVTGKQALSDISSWNLFSVGAATMGASFVALGLRPYVVRSIRAMPDRRTALALLVGNEILAPAGIAMSYWALERGPVSLVSTLISSRPLFVVAFALLLSRIAPEFLFWSGGRRTVLLRIAATVLIVGGIAIIETH